MYYESFGNPENPAIVFLHGANFVQSFYKQYCLSDRYYLIVPHITGYGKESESIYTTEKAKEEITELIKSLNRKVTLIGFSLGAQLAFTLTSDHSELFSGAIIISPWIIKERKTLDKIVKMNEKYINLLQKNWYIKISAKLLAISNEMYDDFAEYTKSAKLETILNSIDNGIEIKDYPQFADTDIPVLVLCGKKELSDVRKSVRHMAELNSKCKCEVWDKAAHNITTKYSERLNSIIDKFMI